MIDYLYGLLTLLIAGVVGWGISRFVKWYLGIAVALIILGVSWMAYHFHYEQYFVRNYGGTMSIDIPEGQHHMLITWKEDHLWIENYDPKTNSCHFNEYSRGHILQGQVVIKNCNPIMPHSVNTQAE